ncbi:hypothetical protein N7451_012696 [Penicillium sp. IBT 35674x]|nr:hypothetical protein N7451_012696 [Penicillium sp. IBT 35674x]
MSDLSSYHIANRHPAFKHNENSAYNCLSPGGLEPPGIYSEFQSHLLARGIHSEAVQHPSTGAEPATKTLADDVSHLRDKLLALCDAGRSVVIVAHSYGGVVASAAVKGLEKSPQHSENDCGRVLMVIYLAAFVIPEGKCLLDVMGGQLLPWIQTSENRAYCAIGSEGAFHDLVPSKREQLYSKLTHNSLPIFSGKASHEPWHGMSTAYVLCEEDKMLPLAFQEHMVEMLGTSHVFRLKTSHHPFLSMPDQVVHIIESLIN